MFRNQLTIVPSQFHFLRRSAASQMSAVLAWLWAGLLALLLGGCSFGQGGSSSNGPQLLSALPQGWVEMSFGRSGLFSRTTTWQEINIDGDPEPEYLLFFTFDNGQVGALIYDLQTGPTTVASPAPVPLPNQPVGTYIPYRVEPSYWTGAGSVGYIAQPNTPSSSITWDQVQRPSGAFQRTTPAVDASAAVTGTAAPTTTPAKDAPPDNELVIYGGSTVMTAVWWQNPYNGYGVAQVSAPGGLVRAQHMDGKDSEPIQNIVGQFPQSGLLQRSVVCRERLYVREPAPDPAAGGAVYQSAVQYSPYDRGLAFCAGPPSYPFYPEGVVLGYLRPENPNDSKQSLKDQQDYRNSLLAPTVTDADRQAFNAMIDLDGPDNQTFPLIVVQDLLTPATISPTPPPAAAASPEVVTPTVPAEMPTDAATAAPAATAGSDQGSGPITTSVCAQIASTDDLLVKRLLFQLVHVPPQTSNVNGTAVTTTDQMKISNLTDVTSVAPTCGGILDLTPEGQPR